jgi:very-short-patch-repair endonuclease
MAPNRSAAQGVELLRKYLAYAASGGNALSGGSTTDVPLNPFELDVFARLSDAGIPLIPQFGVSGYRIDFAASHPEYPGRMVLAIEADGASYHSSATARDRDRLRQQVLEQLGWTFHRIWSTEWFRNPVAETKRAINAWKNAVRQSEVERGKPRRSRDLPESDTPNAHPRSHRPPVRRGKPITDYTYFELESLARWIMSDTLLRTEDEMLEEMMLELGFRRRGARIVSTLTHAIRIARQQP